MFGCRYFKVVPIPGPLLIVIVFTALSWGFGLDQTHNLKVVGAIPSGLPKPQAPRFSIDQAVISKPEHGRAVNFKRKWSFVAVMVLLLIQHSVAVSTAVRLIARKMYWCSENGKRIAQRLVQGIASVWWSAAGTDSLELVQRSVFLLMMREAIGLAATYFVIHISIAKTIAQQKRVWHSKGRFTASPLRAALTIGLAGAA